MKNIDFIIQSALIGASLFTSVVGIFYHEFFFLTLIGQFFLGIWQYGGSLIAMFLKSVKYRKKYFSFASLYLVSLVFLIFFESYFSLSLSITFFLIYLIVPAWILAIYYYRLTWRTIFIEKKQSGFLPHTNF